MKFTTPVAALALASVAGVAALAGCAGAKSSGSSGNAAPGAALTVADVAPFSGADAALGPTYLASCYGAPRPSTPRAACSGTS